MERVTVADLVEALKMCNSALEDREAADRKGYTEQALILSRKVWQFRDGFGWYEAIDKAYAGELDVTIERIAE